MKKLLISIMMLLTSVIFITCNEEEITSRPYPRIKTLPVTSITEEGVEFNAEVLMTGDGSITSYGFVWGRRENPDLESAEKVVFGGNPDEIFSAQVSRALDAGATYFVRSFVETSDYLVYGQNESFVSLGGAGAVITDVRPANIFYGDTLRVYGRNFSEVAGENIIRINGTRLSGLLSISDTLLQVVLPQSVYAAKFSVAVEINNSSVTYGDSIDFKAPVITSISRTEVVFGDTIVIEGDNFEPDPVRGQVLFNLTGSQILEASRERLRVIVPVVGDPQVLSIKNFFGQEGSAAAPSLKPRTFNSAQPVQALINDVVRIEGNNFGYNRFGTTVHVEDLPAQISLASNTFVDFTVPDGIYDSRFPPVIFSDNLSSFDEGIPRRDTAYNVLEIMDPRIKKSGVPGVNNLADRGSSVSFSDGSFGYVGTGGFYDRDFWKYDPLKNTWSRIPDFPGEGRIFASAIAGDDFALVGGGVVSDQSEQIDFYRYNYAAESWQRIADFPYPVRSASGVFLNGGFYVITREFNDNFWFYNPLTDTWTPLPKLDTSIGEGGRADAAFTLGGIIYVYVSGNSTAIHQLYAYDPNTSSWSRKADVLQSGIYMDVTGFAMDGKGYLAGRSRLYEYDPFRDEWINRAFLPVRDLREPVVFPLNGKIFSGGEQSTLSETTPFWEYDPAYD